LLIRKYSVIIDAGSRVYETVERSPVRPAVCLSHRSTAAACDGFAAERPAGRRCRSIAGTGTQQQRRRSTALSSNGAAARRSAANAGSVTLTADVGG